MSVYKKYFYTTAQSDFSDEKSQNKSTLDI